MQDTLEVRLRLYAALTMLTRAIMKWRLIISQSRFHFILQVEGFV